MEKIAYFDSAHDMPEEIVMAAGYVPYKIMGDAHAPLDTVESYLAAFFCPAVLREASWSRPFPVRRTGQGSCSHTGAMPPTAQDLLVIRATYGRDPFGNVIELQEIMDENLPIALTWG